MHETPPLHNVLLPELGLTPALLPPVVSHLTQGEHFHVLRGDRAESTA